MKINKICCALVLSLATFSSYAVEIEKFDTSWDSIADDSNEFVKKEKKGIDAFFAGLERSYLDNPRPISSVTLKEQIIKLIEKCDKLTDDDLKNIKNLLGKPSKEIVSPKQLTYGWLFEDGDVIVIREFSNQDRKVAIYSRNTANDEFFDKNYKNMTNYFALKLKESSYNKLKAYWQDIKKRYEKDGVIYCFPYQAYLEIYKSKKDSIVLNGVVSFKDSPAVRRLLALKSYYQTEAAKTWIFSGGFIVSYNGNKKFDKDGNLCFEFEIGSIDQLDDDKNFDFRLVRIKNLNVDKSFSEKYVTIGLKSIAREAIKTGKINVIPADKLKAIEEKPNNPELGTRLFRLYNSQNKYKELYNLMYKPSYIIDNGHILIRVCVFDNGLIYISILREVNNYTGYDCFVVGVRSFDELKKKFGLDFDKLEKVYTKNKKLK